jgi:hypothetical protein
MPRSFSAAAMPCRPVTPLASICRTIGMTSPRPDIRRPEAPEHRGSKGCDRPDIVPFGLKA